MSNLFYDFKCESFHDACDYVWRLPYGRTSNGRDWRLVLSENIGTCSTKHALLKVLADELGLGIDLILGIYSMKESNTPGVGSVLSASNMEYVPEAHCYLSYEGKRVDLTRFGAKSEEPISVFFIERKIEPHDIGEVKKLIHKQYISEQFGDEQLSKIWAVREECISAICT